MGKVLFTVTMGNNGVDFVFDLTPSVISFRASLKDIMFGVGTFDLTIENGFFDGTSFNLGIYTRSPPVGGNGIFYAFNQEFGLGNYIRIGVGTNTNPSGQTPNDKIIYMGRITTVNPKLENNRAIIEINGKELSTELEQNLITRDYFTLGLTLSTRKLIESILKTDYPEVDSLGGIDTGRLRIDVGTHFIDGTSARGAAYTTPFSAGDGLWNPTYDHRPLMEAIREIMETFILIGYVDFTDKNSAPDSLTGRPKYALVMRKREDAINISSPVLTLEDNSSVNVENTNIVSYDFKRDIEEMKTDVELFAGVQTKIPSLNGDEFTEADDSSQYGKPFSILGPWKAGTDSTSDGATTGASIFSNRTINTNVSGTLPWQLLWDTAITQHIGTSSTGEELVQIIESNVPAPDGVTNSVSSLKLQIENNSSDIPNYGKTNGAQELAVTFKPSLYRAVKNVKLPGFPENVDVIKFNSWGVSSIEFWWRIKAGQLIPFVNKSDISQAILFPSENPADQALAQFEGTTISQNIALVTSSVPPDTNKCLLRIILTDTDGHKISVKTEGSYNLWNPVTIPAGSQATTTWSGYFSGIGTSATGGGIGPIPITTFNWDSVRSIEIRDITSGYGPAVGPGFGLIGPNVEMALWIDKFKFNSQNILATRATNSIQTQEVAKYGLRQLFFDMSDRSAGGNPDLAKLLSTRISGYLMNPQMVLNVDTSIDPSTITSADGINTLFPGYKIQVQIPHLGITTGSPNFRIIEVNYKLDVNGFTTSLELVPADNPSGTLVDYATPSGLRVTQNTLEGIMRNISIVARKIQAAIRLRNAGLRTRPVAPGISGLAHVVAGIQGGKTSVTVGTGHAVNTGQGTGGGVSIASATPGVSIANQSTGGGATAQTNSDSDTTGSIAVNQIFTLDSSHDTGNTISDSSGNITLTVSSIPANSITFFDVYLNLAGSQDVKIQFKNQTTNTLLLGERNTFTGQQTEFRNLCIGDELMSPNDIGSRTYQLQMINASTGAAFSGQVGRIHMFIITINAHSHLVTSPTHVHSVSENSHQHTGSTETSHAHSGTSEASHGHTDTGHSDHSATVDQTAFQLGLS